MKKDELKALYPITPKAHDSLLRTLNTLDDTAVSRREKRRRTTRLAVAFAAIALLAAFTATAYATDLFGLRTERIGRYGLNLTVTEGPDRPAEKKRVKPVIGYIPEGCRLVDGSAENGKYLYTTGGVEYGAELSVGFFIVDADKYNDEGRYIIESEETEINGHRAIIGAQQLEEDGEKSWFGVEYFENSGYIIHYSSNNRGELLKFMQGLDLVEDVSFTEAPSIAEDSEFHSPVDDYAYKMSKDRYRFIEVGDPFVYAEMIYSENGRNQAPDFTVTVTSVEERDSFDGLDRNGVLYSESFSDYFDENNRLITPYLRSDYDFGDGGVNDQITHTDKEIERHFMVVTVEATANADTETYGVPIRALATPVSREKNGGSDSPTDYGQVFLMYRTAADNLTLTEWKKGDTRTYTFGVLVDDEMLGKSCMEFISRRYEIDHHAKTVEDITENFCVMLKGGDAR